VIHGTVSGVMMAPKFVPALKIPVASARSFFRKPLGHSLQARRKISRFAESQSKTRGEKSRERVACGVRHGRAAPENHRQGKTQSGAEPVNQTAHDHHAHRVSRLKRKHEIAVIDLVPTKIMLQRRFQNAEHLPIHVIFRGTKQKERANHPPKITNPSRHDRTGFRGRNRFNGQRCSAFVRCGIHGAARFYRQSQPCRLLTFRRHNVTRSKTSMR
jgi:hypothetical protein